MAISVTKMYISYKNVSYALKFFRSTHKHASVCTDCHKGGLRFIVEGVMTISVHDV
jgi:hypothetical protein